MAIIAEKYLNLAVNTFDGADKYIDMEPAKAVADQAVSSLSAIKKAVVDFATENQDDIRTLYQEVTSEMGSKRNYRMQSTNFAEMSFNEYIAKVISIPEAVKNGTVSDDMCLDAGFFERDRSFIIALFSTEDNEAVPIPAEDAFGELKYMQELMNMTDEFSKQIIDKSSLVPMKTDSMDAVYAKQYDTCLMAVRLMATSMVRFCALMLRHVVNNASSLYAHVTDTRPGYSRGEIPEISWKGDEEPEVDETSRWGVFI